MSTLTTAAIRDAMSTLGEDVTYRTQVRRFGMKISLIIYPDALDVAEFYSPNGVIFDVIYLNEIRADKQLANYEFVNMSEPMAA